MTNSDFVLVPRQTLIDAREYFSERALSDAQRPNGNLEMTLMMEIDEAFSAAPVPPSEPVAWRMPLQGAKGKYQLTQHDDIAAMWRENGATVLPLYAVPPSPPRDEVVKALRELVRFVEVEFLEDDCIENREPGCPSCALIPYMDAAKATLQKLESPHD